MKELYNTLSWNNSKYIVFTYYISKDSYYTTIRKLCRVLKHTLLYKRQLRDSQVNKVDEELCIIKKTTIFVFNPFRGAVWGYTISLTTATFYWSTCIKPRQSRFCTLSTIFRLDLGSVPTAWYFLLF
jgi:hypothetical protein